jgi:hypothetical protein
VLFPPDRDELNAAWSEGRSMTIEQGWNMLASRI